MTPHIAVVTDSAASLPPALAKEWGISVVPLQVIVDGVAEAEGERVGPRGVLDDLIAGKDISTSQPSPEAFLSAFQEAADAGAAAVVAVVISGKISGTVNAAQTAASAATIPVTVVDTLTIAMATGYAAIAAAAHARAGGSVDDVAATARHVAARSLCIFTVDTLEYLRRGGRVSPAVAAVGTVLSVRPVLGIVDGEVALLERVRTTARARDALLTRVEERIADLDRPGVAIMALGDEEFSDDAARMLEAKYSAVAMMVRTPVSAVLAVHTGPGALAAVVVELPAVVGESPRT
jgi:DegV family protein with EDD domain